MFALYEKSRAFERFDHDLAREQDWCNALSPLGKTPVLKIDEHAIFESASSNMP